MTLEELVLEIRHIHDQLRGHLAASCEAESTRVLSAVEREESGDTIYRLDKIAEPLLLRLFENLARKEPLVLVAEGLPSEGIQLPRGKTDVPARWRVIVDPIDGTRGLMYQKRSAWILTAVAPDRGPETRLREVVLAVQTEVPLVKQHLCDQLWAIRDRCVVAERLNRFSGDRTAFRPNPSSATTLLHGYAMLSRFFPGARDLIAAVEEEMLFDLLGPQPAGKALCFEDQYACSGGQFYELAMGHDRFNGDIRPLLAEELRRRGRPVGLCCHPYDVCTALIAEQLGIVLTDPWGEPLDCPLNLESDVAWVGYANEELRRVVEPVFQRVLRQHGLL